MTANKKTVNAVNYFGDKVPGTPVTKSLSAIK